MHDDWLVVAPRYQRAVQRIEALRAGMNSRSPHTSILPDLNLEVYGSDSLEYFEC